MNSKADSLKIGFADAICYSGYREGQSPLGNQFPTYEQIREDLEILQENWQQIRLYDCSNHAETVLKVIRNEGLNLKVMLGANLQAEVSNPNCPWGAHFSPHQLKIQQQENELEIEKLILLANHYADIVRYVSIGNEASVEWSDHLVPVESLVCYARRLKSALAQPVTFCENYLPWQQKLEPLAQVLDFISLHTYPVWEYKTIDAALEYTQHNFQYVAQHYPDKPVVITEAGWTTRSNGRGIEPWNATEEFQAVYYSQLLDWCKEHDILCFVFEAFDEPWKGSDDLHEPEKHWGLFTVDRKPKLAMAEIFAHL